MVLHIDVSELVKGTVIETNRVEYKAGWNPEKALHTICAFANDYEGTYGGYLVIGVSENNGVPDRICGVEDADVPRIEKELFNLCNMIEPRYVPGFAVERYDGRNIIVIWAFSDLNRPFKCPVGIGSSHKGGEKAYYIRRSAHTVRANAREEQVLIANRRFASFDEDINPNSSESDIERDLVIDYLNRVDSSIIRTSISTESLLESLRLVAGPHEARCAVNCALLMFNSDPERFFEGCRIELVEKPFANGTGMTETVFKGPVDGQIRRVLQTIRNGCIKEKTFKVEGRAEARRVWNYPFEAVEEAVVNAVYHKDFRVKEPVVITVTPDTLEIVTYPGLDSEISDDDVRRLDFRSHFTRNRRLGDFLKELRLVEERNTGIPTIREALSRNGSPMPEYRMDHDRTFLEVVFPVHPEFREQSRESSSDQSVSMDDRILGILRDEGCRSTGYIARALGYSRITGPVRRTILSMLDDGRVVYLYPDNPRDPRQRICLPSRSGNGN